MSQNQGPAQRVLDAGKQLFGNLVATGETRLRLAIVELEEERARLVIMAILIGLGLILLLLGIGALTTLVIVIFWDTHRLTAIGVSAAVLIVSGLLSLAWVIRMARKRTLLASTLKHLAMDRALLEAHDESQR